MANDERRATAALSEYNEARQHFETIKCDKFETDLKSIKLKADYKSAKKRFKRTSTFSTQPSHMQRFLDHVKYITCWLAVILPATLYIVMIWISSVHY